MRFLHRRSGFLGPRPILWEISMSFISQVMVAELTIEKSEHVWCTLDSGTDLEEL